MFNVTATNQMPKRTSVVLCVGKNSKRILALPNPTIRYHRTQPHPHFLIKRFQFSSHTRAGLGLGTVVVFDDYIVLSVSVLLTAKFCFPLIHITG